MPSQATYAEPANVPGLSIGAGVCLDLAFAITESHTLLLEAQVKLDALMTAADHVARDTAMEDYRDTMGTINALGANMANAILNSQS